MQLGLKKLKPAISIVAFTATLILSATNVLAEDLEAPWVSLDSKSYTDGTFKTYKNTLGLLGTAGDETAVSDVQISIDSGAWESCQPMLPTTEFGGTDVYYKCILTDLAAGETISVSIKSVDSSNNESDPITYSVERYANSSGLFSHWTFNDLTTGITDAQQVMSTLEFHNESDITEITGNTDGALNFLGGSSLHTNDYSGQFAFDQADSKFMVEAYVKRTAFDSESFIAGETIYNYSDDTEYENWYMGTDTGGGIRCAIVSTNNVSTELNTSSLDPAVVLTGDAWNLIACSYDASTGEISAYLNGELVGSKNVPEGENIIRSNYSELFEINNIFYGNSTIPSLDTAIDEVKIYYGVTGYTEEPAAPTIVLTDSDNITTSGDITVTGTLTSGSGSASVIDGMSFRLHDTKFDTYSDWSGESCSADDGAYDETVESFTCTVSVPNDKKMYIAEFEAIDAELSTTLPENFAKLKIFNDSDETLRAWVNFGDPEAPLDFTNNYSVDAVGTVSSGTGPEGMTTASLGGEGQYTLNDALGELSFNESDGQYTIKLRVKPSSSMLDSGLNYPLLKKTFSDGSDTSWELGIRDNLHLFSSFYYLPDEYLMPGYETETNNELVADEWNEIYMSWSNKSKGIVIRVNDGTPIQTYYDLTAEELEVSDDPIQIGGDASNSNRFIGEIDDIFIFNSSDVETPQITVTPLTNKERVATSTPTFNVSITDETGIKSFEYLFSDSAENDDLDSLSWISAESPSDGSWGGTTETLSITPAALADGEWYLYMRATDNNDLKSQYTNVGWSTYFIVSTTSAMPYYRFKVEVRDTTPPSIYAQEIIPNPTTDRQPVLVGYVKDYVVQNQGETASNIAEIKYSIDGSNYENATVADNSLDSALERFYISLSALTVGEHTVVIEAEDTSGNSTSTRATNANYGNVSHTFTIVAPPSNLTTSSIVQEETFDDHDMEDTLFSNGVWGNGKIRIKENIDFSTDTLLFTNNDQFGTQFGDTDLGTYPSADGNLWIALNDGSFGYFDLSDNTLTQYDRLLSKTTIVSKITEFTSGLKTYLVLNLEGGATMIYDINNTPKVISDDVSPLNYESAGSIIYSTDTSKLYSRFTTFGIDTRNDGLAIFGTLTSASGDDYIIRVDTNNTIMDVTDDTFTLWSSDDGILQSGITSDITSALFDQDNNLLVLSSYNYRTYVCSDGGNPSDESGYICADHGTFTADRAVFSMQKDPNGWIWMGGDRGITRLDTNGTIQPDDDTFVRVIGTADIDNEQIGQLVWVEGPDAVGDEVAFMTRQGHLRVLEYNSTYDDALDDNYYLYQIPGIESRAGGNVSFAYPNRGSVYTTAPGIGILGITLTRDFEDSNVVELLPVTPDGLLEVSHITLDQVIGTVSEGSDAELSDLVSYDVSNDAGVTWYPITLGQTVNFTESDYKLKLRITMTKGSTPLIDYVKVSYIAAPGVNSQHTDDNTEESDDNSCSKTAPSGKPTIYRIEPIGTDKLKIYFNPDNPPMNSYNIQVGESTEFFYLSKDIYSYQDGTYTIENLKPDTKYYLKLRAKNDCKKGAWSDIISARTNSLNQSNLYGELEPIKQEPTDSSQSTPEAPLRPILDLENGKVNMPSISITDNQVLSIFTNAAQTNKVAALSLAMALSNTVMLAVANFFTSPKAFKLKYFSVGFLKKKRKPWGVVYDSKTKQPLDPVVITLTGQDGKTHQVVSDMYGRYDFIVEPGLYKLRASKTDYAFPSAIVRSQADEMIYDNILVTETITVTDKDTVRYNIPMDMLSPDWNQLEKVRMGIKGPNPLWTLLTRVAYYCGIVWSYVAVILNPSFSNAVVTAVFTLYAIYRVLYDRYNAWGTVTGSDGNPKAGAIVHLVNPKFPNLAGNKAVTDKWGRYNFLVGKGTYQVKVERLNNSIPEVLAESEIIEVNASYGKVAVPIRLRALSHKY